MTTVPFVFDQKKESRSLPYRGTAGIWCLIVAEATMFMIFVVAYIYNIGKSLSGPTPKEVLELPIFTTLCLLSSSITVHLSVEGLRKRRQSSFLAWLVATVLLGLIFILGTAHEWYHLIYVDGLTIRTNLFGTTFYSLVGLHATHVIVGLLMLGVVLLFGLYGKVGEEQTHRFHTLSMYWHFVDAVWVVVFTVVYVIGR